MGPTAMARFMEYARTYQSRFRAAVDGWDLAAAERIAEVLLKARQEGRHVLVAGNGGSAAISNHFECDASKGTHVHGCPPLRTRSLAANASVLTALGNDVGFESIFDRQVDYYAQPGDVVILVSSSGNSPNVVRACRRAKELGLTTVALVGFGGGKLKELADHALHVPVDNYGVAEDMHQATVHLVTQFLYDLWKTECAAAPPDPAPVPVPAPLVVAAGAEVLPGEGARPTGAAWAPPVPVPALAGEDTVPSSAGGTTGELPDPVAPGAVPGEVPPPPPLSPVAPSTPVEVQQGVVRRAGGGWWRRRAREVSYLVQVAAWLAWTAGRSLGGGLAGWGAALAASERAATWAARLMALGTVVGAALIARFTLWGFPNSADEQDYLWISERLLEGRLSIPAPKIWPVVEFWWRMVKDGRELAQYPATWPAVMVPFVALGVPWLTGSVVAGVGVLLVYRLCREAYGSRATGLVAAFLLGTNAMFLMNAASFFPHTLCQTLGVAGLLLLWRSVFSETPRAPFMAGLWPGLVAGVCASVRPPDAVASLGVAALVAGLVAVRRPKWTGWWVLGGLTGAVVGILPLLLHNRWATGHFLRTAYQLFDSRYDGITFQWSYWMSRWSVVDAYRNEFKNWAIDPALLIPVALVLLVLPGKVKSKGLDLALVGTVPLVAINILSFPLLVLHHNSYGPRYASMILIPMVILVARLLVAVPALPRVTLVVALAALYPQMDQLSRQRGVYGPRVTERSTLHRAMADSLLQDAVVFMSGNTGDMDQRDLVRNDAEFKNPVVYAHDRGASGNVEALHQMFPGRRGFAWKYTGAPGRGTLTPLDATVGRPMRPALKVENAKLVVGPVPPLRPVEPPYVLGPTEFHHEGGSARDGGWAQESNGVVRAIINFPRSGAFDVVVWMKGEPAAGENARAKLEVDGVEVATVEVLPNEFRAYSLGSHRVDAGLHTFGARFVNDHWGGSAKQDRNLLVSKFVITEAAVPGQDL